MVSLFLHAPGLLKGIIFKNTSTNEFTIGINYNPCL